MTKRREDETYEDYRLRRILENRRTQTALKGKMVEQNSTSLNRERKRLLEHADRRTIIIQRCDETITFGEKLNIVADEFKLAKQNYIREKENATISMLQEMLSELVSAVNHNLPKQQED